MQTPQSILVPLDGSAPSLAALDHAVALAVDYGAHLEVLHVIPKDDPRTTSARMDERHSMDIAVERARSALGARLDDRWVEGDPEREIVDAARDHIDLIVIGTHGSVSEGVVREAPCPVVTVRDEGTVESSGSRDMRT
jgi:nucleotide-binding universal stress UspA family protein